ncbi:MAG: hypothetical protein ACREOH_01800 [Candidatus Entotheonellia bacterium]
MLRRSASDILFRTRSLLPFAVSLWSFTILFVASTATAFSPRVPLAWNPSSSADLAGYILYYGYSSRNYVGSIDVKGLTNYTFTGPEDRVVYYLAVTAYSTSGDESNFSNEITYDTVTADTDRDGITDRDEVDYYGTDPYKADTDGDGLTDGAEVRLWGSAWNGDADRDGIINLLDPDSDNDGFSDGTEVQLASNPLDSGDNPGHIDLAWNPNPELFLAGYILYHGFQSKGYSGSIDVGKQTTYSIKGLEHGKTYYFSVTAYDIYGDESPFSAEVKYLVP